MRYRKMFLYEGIFEKHGNPLRLESMDYDTRVYKVPNIYRKAIEFIFDSHELMYSELGGNKEFKAIISKYEAALTWVESDNKMIFVGSGVSSLVNSVIESILKLPENGKRKNVVLFSPDYPLFHSSVEVAGGVPIVIKARRSNNYLPTFDEVCEAVTEHTAAILFSNFNNPTGKGFSHEWIRDLVALADRKDFFIVSDEVYSQMLFSPNTFTHIPSLTGRYKNYVKLFGLSKDRPGMTGMRTGYCIGDQRLFESIYDIQMIRNFSGNVVSDYIFLIDLALRYLDLSNNKILELSYFEEDDIQNYYATILDNKKYLESSVQSVISALEKNKNVVDVILPDGGNSVFFRYYKSLSSSKLLHEFLGKGLAAYPTDAFNLDPSKEGSWMRICVTRKIEYLKNMIRKI